MLQKVLTRENLEGRISGMNQTDLIIDPEDFPVFLKGKLGSDTVATFAKKLGVSQKLVYYLISGQRPPSKAILKKLGLKIAFVVDRSTATREKK
jgi:hypothetical protein